MTGDRRRADERAKRMLSPYEFEVAWYLAHWDAEDATAGDIYERGFARRPDYQRWTPKKVATVLMSLRRRGLVTDSGETDAQLPGKQPRRWRLTENGQSWLSGGHGGGQPR